MLYIEGNSLLEVATPAFVRLSRQAIDEVDADVLEAMPTAAADGFDGLTGIVAAVQQAEGGVVEGLYAHAEAVEGQAAEHGYVLFGQVVGVCLKGNLFTGIEAIDVGQGVEYLAEIFLLELRGCATAEIDGTDGLALQVVAAHREFIAQGVDVASFQVAACGGVEVAIDASRLAERDVDIDTCHEYSLVLMLQK